MRVESESLHESFLNSHGPVKREQELHESWWELRVCMRVFSTLVSQLNEEQELHESWWELRVCMRVFSTLMSRSNENKSCMRVDESWEFVWEFSQLSCPGQTRTRVAWELMRVESLHESFLNSRVPVKREQELHESWEARVCMRVFSTPCPSQTRTRVTWKLSSKFENSQRKLSSKFECWWELIWQRLISIKHNCYHMKLTNFYS
jgi:hypothetical protein